MGFKFIIKILLLSILIFFIPIRMIIFYSLIFIIIIMLLLNLNNLTNYMLAFNLDLISIRIILLRFYVLILIIIRQFLSNFLKNLFFIFVMLNVRLMYTFSASNIIIFYFFLNDL